MKGSASGLRRTGTCTRKGLPQEKLPVAERPPATQEREAVRCAYRLLGYRGRSEKELKERLGMKGFETPVIGRVVDRLLSEGFLDDRKLASSLKRYAEETKHLGISGTKRFLWARGIPPDIIEETVRGAEETETACRLVEKKMRSLGRYPLEKVTRKLYGMLYRKGYSPGTIRKALDCLGKGKERE